MNLMTTRFVWHMLNSPNVEAPLYRYLQIAHHRYAMWTSSGQDVFVLIFFMVFATFSAPLFLLLPILNVFVFSTYWAALIADGIQSEHQEGRLDLLALLPGGQIAVYQTMTILRLRYSGIYDYAKDGLQVIKLIGGVLLFVLTASLLVSGIGGWGSARYEDTMQILNMLLLVITLGIAMYIDQIQSIVLCCLTGMITPLYTALPIEARLWGGTAFFTGQLVYYSMFVLSVNVLNRLLPNHPLRLSLVVLVISFTMVALREITIRRLGSTLLRLLGEPI